MFCWKFTSMSMSMPRPVACVSAGVHVVSVVGIIHVPLHPSVRYSGCVLVVVVDVDAISVVPIGKSSNLSHPPLEFNKPRCHRARDESNLLFEHRDVVCKQSCLFIRETSSRRVHIEVRRDDQQRILQSSPFDRCACVLFCKTSAVL